MRRRLFVSWYLALLVVSLIVFFVRRRRNAWTELYDITDMTLKEDGPAFDAKFGTKVAFFMETSGEGYLRPREVCAIESLAKTNPDMQAVLVFTYPVQNLNLRKNPTLAAVSRKMKNLHIVTMNSTKVLLNSPIFRQKLNILQQSKFPTVFLSDFLRVLLVYTFGGIYFDTDFIIFKDLSPLLEKNNFVTKPKGQPLVNSCVFSFERKHPFAEKLMKTVGERFNPKNYASAPAAFKVAVEDFFKMDLEQAIEKSPFEGVTVMDYIEFSPIFYYDFRQIFNESFVSLADEIVRSSYASHMWNYMGWSLKLDLNSKAPYAILARRFCPITVHNIEGGF
ncbi:lactosylceramide 4-alpha-galactosyltransferase-like [Neocloeon triangulifer]|uniref:lactosylceramide 4-alpha-galactosyltransferase-like n=1 Tax=Neocloeon triangulifer TaxID=2078957 RepID=UPI00286F1AD0|nr:lactosylceramide 4-alpha-galactosyltransferase-like [Neocloeon triangulifer]